jgi:hypothetical protein
MQDLDIAQKRALVAKKIQSLRSEARYNAQSLLGALDSCIELSFAHGWYCRHLGDFAPPALATPSVLH